MLTRKIALARLREFGTLAPTPRKLTLIHPKAIDMALARDVERMIEATRATRGERWSAPAASHSVLP